MKSFISFCLIRLLLLACAVLPALVGNGQALVTAPPAKVVVAPCLLDNLNTFRGYHFGDSINSFGGLSLVRRVGQASFYTKNQETFSVGKVVVSSITYGFYADKLVSICLITDGSKNNDALARLITDTYGAGKHPGKQSATTHWLGSMVCTTYRLDQRNATATALIMQTEHRQYLRAVASLAPWLPATGFNPGTMPRAELASAYPHWRKTDRSNHRRKRRIAYAKERAWTRYIV